MDYEMENFENGYILRFYLEVLFSQKISIVNCKRVNTTRNFEFILFCGAAGYFCLSFTTSPITIYN